MLITVLHQAMVWKCQTVPSPGTDSGSVQPLEIIDLEYCAWIGCLLFFGTELCRPSLHDNTR
jgi:hypothetical protein